jgi:hypothetical protein
MAMSLYSGYRGGKFCVVEGAILAGFVRFAGGFLWTGRGGLRGKDGQRFAWF